MAVAKLKQLVTLLHMSRRTVLYTGAGISASVVGQAARSGSNKTGWEKTDLFAVRPTATHMALAELGKAGLIHSWLQQNHDGLPQKVLWLTLCTLIQPSSLTKALSGGIPTGNDQRDSWLVV